MIRTLTIHHEQSAEEGFCTEREASKIFKLFFVRHIAKEKKICNLFKTETVILKATSNDMMNSIARSVLTLFCYDKNANDTTIDNVLRQCIQLISVFPLLSVYGYHAYNHYQRDNSLYIHRAEPTMSTAEVILSLLRPDRHYTPLEAKVLDMALILHIVNLNICTAVLRTFE